MLRQAGGDARTRNAEHTGNEGLRDWIRVWGLSNAGIDTQRSLHQSAGRPAVAVRRVHVDATPAPHDQDKQLWRIQGGISNGAPIYLTVGFKPPATIGQAQQTATYGEEDGVLEAKGRHDPCLVFRGVPIVEAGGADDHRLTLSAAGAADGEELTTAAQENRPRRANGGGEGGEEL